MKIARLVGLVVMAVLALNLMAAAVASASAPEFSPGALNTFTGESGTGALETTSTAAITCTKDTNTGEITGAKTVGGVVVTFTGCSSKEGSGCSVKSPTQPAGTVVTTTLSGELGSVKKTEATSGVGLLLKPASGTKFVELEGGCLLVSPSPVNGSIAGEATPVNAVSSKDGKLLFVGSKGTQNIKSINVLGTTESPELKALGLIKSSETTSELVTYSSPIIVT
jgi:hypothetical protein